MSHSQWEKKKYKKAGSEAKTSKLYSKLVRAITVEAKKCAGNREAPGLKSAIEKARDVDMPNDNIERAIKKATEAGENFESITYEAYGPGGTGLIIEALTASRNKAAQEIKHILSLHGGVLGAIGSVTWNFTKEHGEWMPTSTIPLSPADQELFDTLVDALEDNDEVQDVFSNEQTTE
jgi:transcriptional/translational regulatory protein YebC/TACO1